MLMVTDSPSKVASVDWIIVVVNVSVVGTIIHKKGHQHKILNL